MSEKKSQKNIEDIAEIEIVTMGVKINAEQAQSPYKERDQPQQINQSLELTPNNRKPEYVDD